MCDTGFVFQCDSGPEANFNNSTQVLVKQLQMNCIYDDPDVNCGG